MKSSDVFNCRESKAGRGYHSLLVVIILIIISPCNAGTASTAAPTAASAAVTTTTAAYNGTTAASNTLSFQQLLAITVLSTLLGVTLLVLLGFGCFMCGVCRERRILMQQDNAAYNSANFTIPPAQQERIIPTKADILRSAGNPNRYWNQAVVGPILANDSMDQGYNSYPSNMEWNNFVGRR